MIYYRCFLAYADSEERQWQEIVNALSDSAFGDIRLSRGDSEITVHRDEHATRVTLEPLPGAAHQILGKELLSPWIAAIGPDDDCSQESMYLAWEALNLLSMSIGRAVWLYERAYGETAVAQHAKVRPLTFAGGDTGFVLTAEEFSALAES